MQTTIQIKRSTLEKLKQLKQEKELPNYDVVIEYLITKERDVPASLFGFMKGKMASFTHDGDDEDHAL